MAAKDSKSKVPKRLQGLWWHPTGSYAKKSKGITYYFGKDPEAAAKRMPMNRLISRRSGAGPMRQKWRGLLSMPCAMNSLTTAKRHCAHVDVRSSTTPPPESQEIMLPDGLIPIAALPVSHPAPSYLQQRNFDLATLNSTWGVTFCDSCLNCWPVATNRIVIPVYRPGLLFARPETEPQTPVLGGWQARSASGKVRKNSTKTHPPLSVTHGRNRHCLPCGTDPSCL